MSEGHVASERRNSKDLLPPRIPEQTSSAAEDRDSTTKQDLKSHIETHLLIHDSLMRQAQWGFTATGERSRDLFPDLSERQQSHSSEQSLLEHKISMQKSLYEFSGILKEIDEVSKVAKDYHEKGNRYHVAGMVVVAVVALGVVAALFTGGGSLAVAAAATAGAAVTYLIKMSRNYKDKIKTTAEKIEKSVKEFRETLQLLKNNLVNIKIMSEKLQESTVLIMSTLILKKVEEVHEVHKQLSELGRILLLLQGGGLVSSVGQLFGRSEQVFVKLEELQKK